MTYVTTDIPGAKQTLDLDPSTLSYTITGLNATTKYTISVFASTRKGPGPARSADIESGVPPGKENYRNFPAMMSSRQISLLPGYRVGVSN